MSGAINTNEQMIKRINDVLKSKRDAVVNIVNDKLTISVMWSLFWIVVYGMIKAGQQALWKSMWSL